MKRRAFLGAIYLLAANGWTAVTRKMPAWRNGMALGKFSPIPSSSPNKFNLEPTWNKRGTNICWGRDIIDAWNGLQTDDTRGVIYSALAGGHAATEQNGVYKIDLMQDKPQWSIVRVSTPFNPRDPANQGTPYFSDGRPTSRHTYYDGHCVDINGSPVVVFVKASAQTYISSGSNQVDAFHVATGDWDLNGRTWQAFPGKQNYSMPSAKDPRNQFIYVTDASVSFNIFRLNPATRTWTLLAGSPNGHQMGWWGSTLDTVRDRFVIAGSYSHAPPAFSIFNINAKTYQDKPLTGLSAKHYEQSAPYTGLLHDPIGDRYLWMNNDGTVLSINPDTWSCSVLTTTSPAVNGVQNRFAFIPMLAGCFYLPEWKSDILFLPLA